MAIDPDALAQITYFIPKANLGRMKRVTGVLHHFGFGDGGSLQRRLDHPIQVLDCIAAPLIPLADNRKWRVMEIVYSRRLTHELRVHADAKVASRFLG